jgi:hypothetical protein
MNKSRNFILGAICAFVVGSRISYDIIQYQGRYFPEMLLFPLLTASLIFNHEFRKFVLQILTDRDFQLGMGALALVFTFAIKNNIKFEDAYPDLRAQIMFLIVYLAVNGLVVRGYFVEDFALGYFMSVSVQDLLGRTLVPFGTNGIDDDGIRTVMCYSAPIGIAILGYRRQSSYLGFISIVVCLVMFFLGLYRKNLIAAVGCCGLTIATLISELGNNEKRWSVSKFVLFIVTPALIIGLSCWFYDDAIDSLKQSATINFFGAERLLELGEALSGKSEGIESERSDSIKVMFSQHLLDMVLPFGMGWRNIWQSEIIGRFGEYSILSTADSLPFYFCFHFGAVLSSLIFIKVVKIILNGFKMIRGADDLVYLASVIFLMVTLSLSDGLIIAVLNHAAVSAFVIALAFTYRINKYS